MKNFKSIVALLLCAVMALATASCSATTSEANDETPVLSEGVQGIPENSLGVPDQTTYPSPTINQLDKTTQQGLLEADEHEIKNTDGSFTVPFDVAYPEAFEAGVFEYDPSVLLLKMDSEFDGQLTSELKACGFEALEAFCAVTNGTWYRATLSENAVITEAAAKAREVDEIITVDYDYLSEKASDDEVQWWNSEVDSNPRVNEQWYLDSCHIQETWAYLAEQGINPGGSSSVIVAVIDTGVDYTHPDLASSMWVNPGEIPGNGIDDDGNGYKDDVHGCSTIGSSYDHSGNPMDDHGHGTHVAGIIGAANNKEGIVGIAYNTKIMAVKAGQASGVFNQSDIAEAILYAYENGAEVINMSFGGTACSLAVQETLELAWTRAVLVASAGNDSRPNTNTFYYTAMPCYPANLFYVIGVMSVNQSSIESTFSNWDASVNGYNLYAPGERILSTLPNGEYGYLNGTSMAAPVVAGIAALLRSKFTDRDMYPAKFVTGQLCSTSEIKAICVDQEHHRLLTLDNSIGPPHEMKQIVNGYAALTKMPRPELYMGDFFLFDDPAISAANNGDGVIDAGETVDIGVILYNRWGMSKDTIVTIDAISDNGMDNPYVEIVHGISNFEGVGTYSYKDQLLRDNNGLIIGVDEPLRIKIREDCPNDTLIVLNVTIVCKNGLDDKDCNEYVFNKNLRKEPAQIQFGIRRGVLMPMEIKENTTLTSDKYYIVGELCYIHEGVTVTVEAGTQIQFYNPGDGDIYEERSNPEIRVAGTLVFNGFEDNCIRLFPCTIKDFSNSLVVLNEINGGTMIFNYVEVTNAYINANAGYDHAATGMRTNTIVRNCSFLLDGTASSYRSANKVIAKEFSHSVATDVLYTEYDSAITTTIIAPVIEKSEVYKHSAILVKDSLVLGNNKEGIYENCLIAYSPQPSYHTKWFLNSVVLDGAPAYSEDPYIYNFCDEGDGRPFVSVFANEETNSLYLQIRWKYHQYFDYKDELDISIVEYETLCNLARYLGGELMCIETEAEWEYIQQNQITGICGLQYGESAWVNGAPVGEWMNIEELGYWYQPSPNVYQYVDFASPTSPLTIRVRREYIDNNYVTETQACWGFPQDYDMYSANANIVFEFPLDTNSNLDEASLLQEIKQWCEEGNYVRYSYNNAYLNNYNNPDITKWGRVEAPKNPNDINIYSVNFIYWGTADEYLIEKRIIDKQDYLFDYADLLSDKYLTVPPEDVWPFVVDAYLLNQNGERVRTVNNETVTFVVEFNRDMDTSVPLKVTFGSSAECFYEDYNISEHGKWVTPRRWEATYTLKTIIENGNHTIKIENGCAADNEWLKLYDAPGRFMFEIDTTAAQALIMQGHATETGVQLSWMQDDYDTLMGYNVYRSDREDGYYQRLNSAVIPYDQKEFFDDTVEPGKVYYYNFTVVKTDLTESEPSGKISLMSMDTMAPNMYHSPVYSARTGANLIIGATVTDNLGVHEVVLYYRAVGETEWRKTSMTALNSRYTGIIPAEFLSLEGMEYYLCAYDGINYTYKGSADSPYVVAVQLAVDDSALGDVDGDGIITNKDALMLLQAANDLLNLTEEQFLRADINKDGELSASEALRILQYVSGKVTTIVE